MARLKQYIVRKYVMAKTASDAIRNERHYKADEVWIDEEWLKNNVESNTKKVGFNGKKD